MKELENKIIEFVQKRGWDQLEHPECLIKSISIEAGELLECIQWDNDYKTENISEELADVMIYCFQLAYSLNLDVSTIIEKKLIKNAEKYYINGGIIDERRFIEKDFNENDEFVRVYSSKEFIGIGKIIRKNNTISVKSDKLFIV